MSAVEEAMVKGFPFDVPKEYASRPLLMVGGAQAAAAGLCVQREREAEFASARGTFTGHTWGSEQAAQFTERA